MNRKKVLIAAAIIATASLCSGIGIGILISAKQADSDKQEAKPALATSTGVMPPDMVAPEPLAGTPPPPVTVMVQGPGGRYVNATQQAGHQDFAWGPTQRAVEYDGVVPQTSNQAVFVDERGEPVQAPQQPIGRNGLLSNPPVDPISSQGPAYRRGSYY